jgi:hypothetical protein
LMSRMSSASIHLIEYNKAIELGCQLHLDARA